MSKLYEISVKDRQGNDVLLEQYKGKVLLIVNTATGCGFTPQYEALEKMYEKYRDQGFEILDFPCNQFFGQAPGSDEEIHSFCTLKYNTQFPRFHKIDVNGKNEDPLYTFLKSQIKGRIKWNFTKFLVNRDGEVVDRFGPADKPEKFENKIAALLK
ncbi:MAG: glutathione peroxidase [Bacilli bacterium]|nr:glutathione peroxidase [Bacilli bacterium]